MNKQKKIECKNQGQRPILSISESKPSRDYTVSKKNRKLNVCKLVISGLCDIITIGKRSQMPINIFIVD